MVKIGMLAIASLLALGSSTAFAQQAITDANLSVDLVRPSYERNVKQSGPNLSVSSILGVYQEGKSAVVFYTVAGASHIGGPMSIASHCYYLVDKRWLCAGNIPAESPRWFFLVI